MDRIPILRMGDVLLVTIQVDLHDRIALQLQDDLTRMIEQVGARGVIIDISALEIVDSFIGRIIADTSAMSKVLDAAVEQVRPLIEAREHTLHVAVPDAPVIVEGDRTRLVQVIANLLNNAAKYTPPSGRIAASLDARPTGVTVAVEDSGAGIPPELLPHVFELFTQAERTPDRAQGGLGVGLALVRSLIALHGGRVEAASAGER
jgi:signal transduction histidine kinase